MKSVNFRLLALLVALPTFLVTGCPRTPLPGVEDLEGDRFDLGPSEDGPTAALLLATGQRPLLDGITTTGALVYHDGDEEWALSTTPGGAKVRLCQGRLAQSAQVRGPVVLSLYDGRDGGARLSAWVAGEAPVELDSRAHPVAQAIAASPKGGYVAFVRLADLTATTGHVQIRKRDGSGAATSPPEVRDLGLVGCPLSLGFHDETHLVVHACRQADRLPRVVVVDAQSGDVVALSQGESVEQVRFSPSGRVAWLNAATSKVDPSALKSVAADGLGAKLLRAGVPVAERSQLTLSPQGEAGYFLDAAGLLQRVLLSGAGGGALGTGKVEHIIQVAPDGRGLAVLLADRVAIVDTQSGAKVGPQPGAGVTLPAQVFTADSSALLYQEAGRLYAFPVAGGSRLDLGGVAGVAPFVGPQVAVLRDVRGDSGSVALIDAASGQAQELAQGVGPGAAGSWLLGAAQRRLVLVKGAAIYVIAL